MSDMHRRVSTMSIVPLLLCAREEGIDVHELLAGSALSEEFLRDPHQTLSFTQELGIVRRYLALTDDEQPALRCSAFYHYNSFGVLGAALVSHASMLEACHFLVRYVDLTFTPFHVVLQEDGEAIEARYIDRTDLEDCREFYLLRDLAFIRNLCCEADPEHWSSLVEAMDIDMEEPAGAATLRDYFQWPLRFGQEETRIQARRTALNRPLRLANPATLSMLQRHCDELLELRRHHSWRLRVEALLIQHPACADLSQVAAQLCCSERTLRRHLQQEGCTFQDIVNDMLQQRATHYLRHSRWPIETIASRLGYSETAAFAHAFKRWTGITPRQFRQSTQTTPAQDKS